MVNSITIRCVWRWIVVVAVALFALVKAEFTGCPPGKVFCPSLRECGPPGCFDDTPNKDFCDWRKQLPQGFVYDIGKDSYVDVKEIRSCFGSKMDQKTGRCNFGKGSSSKRCEQDYKMNSPKVLCMTIHYKRSTNNFNNEEGCNFRKESRSKRCQQDYKMNAPRARVLCLSMHHKKATNNFKNQEQGFVSASKEIQAKSEISAIKVCKQGCVMNLLKGICMKNCNTNSIKQNDNPLKYEHNFRIQNHHTNYQNKCKPGDIFCVSNYICLNRHNNFKRKYDYLGKCKPGCRIGVSNNLSMNKHNKKSRQKKCKQGYIMCVSSGVCKKMSSQKKMEHENFSKLDVSSCSQRSVYCLNTRNLIKANRDFRGNNKLCLSRRYRNQQFLDTSPHSQCSRDEWYCLDKGKCLKACTGGTNMCPKHVTMVTNFTMCLEDSHCDKEAQCCTNSHGYRQCSASNGTVLYNSACKITGMTPTDIECKNLWDCSHDAICCNATCWASSCDSSKQDHDTTRTLFQANSAKPIVRSLVMRITGDYSAIVENRLEAFKESLIQQLAKALKIQKTQIKIPSVRPGSILATVEITEDNNPTERHLNTNDAFTELLDLLSDGDLSLFDLDNQPLTIPQQDGTGSVLIVKEAKNSDDTVIIVVVVLVVLLVIISTIVIFFVVTKKNKRRSGNKVMTLQVVDQQVAPTYRSVHSDYGLEGNKSMAAYNHKLQVFLPQGHSGEENIYMWKDNEASLKGLQTIPDAASYEEPSQSDLDKTPTKLLQLQSQVPGSA